MTLAIAWVRTAGQHKELIIASDSRLTGGAKWDFAPKIQLMPRSDFVMCFAGETYDAYPLMLQIRNWIEMYLPAQERSMDLYQVKGHILRALNSMRDCIWDFPISQSSPSPPECEFLVGGWSWKKQKFQIWRIFFSNTENKFQLERSGSGHKISKRHTISFAGTTEAIQFAKRQIVDSLRNKNCLSGDSLDIEPLEALIEVIRLSKFDDVGGAPQIAKVYMHMNTVPFSIFWPNLASGKVSVLGRPLLDYEKTRWPIIDPDDIKFRPVGHQKR